MNENDYNYDEDIAGEPKEIASPPISERSYEKVPEEELTMKPPAGRGYVLEKVATFKRLFSEGELIELEDIIYNVKLLAFKAFLLFLFFSIVTAFNIVEMYDDYKRFFDIKISNQVVFVIFSFALLYNIIYIYKVINLLFKLKKDLKAKEVFAASFIGSDLTHENSDDSDVMEFLTISGLIWNDGKSHGNIRLEDFNTMTIRAGQIKFKR